MFLILTSPKNDISMLPVTVKNQHYGCSEKEVKEKKKLNHKGRMFNRSGIKVTLVLLSKARVFFNPIFCKTNMFNIKITIMQVSLKSCLYFFNCKSVALNWQKC